MPIMLEAFLSESGTFLWLSSFQIQTLFLLSFGNSEKDIGFTYCK